MASKQNNETIDRTFDPASIEAKWYTHWEENGLFRPDRCAAEPFTIVNPPPNVTGSLHIGHALDNTLQDIMVRYERLRGKDALWVVGTDHAGIATQMVVERRLEANQDKRTNYSREEFVEKVWEWKRESGGTITGQLRRLGCSMDWSREQFTMDEHFSKAVLKTFVRLYNDGLIYRDKRLVNWDPKLKTAISDLEVEQETVAGSFWHIRYPLEDGVTLDSGANYLEVATTRPETLLADMAVAVHPSDERYASVVGKHVILPITGRKVPIVADEHADPELGSGAVKITPGHDFNDFEVGKRAGIAAGDMLNMLDAEANVCQTADGLVPQEYLGLHRFKRDGTDGARELLVRRLKESGHLIPHVVEKDGERVEHDSEPRQIATPFGDRGGVVIEPWLTDQWYVDAEKLAVAPMDAVRIGEVEIVPKSWEKTFFNWMENIQPWCVSRQLWWGHRIPAWYIPKVEKHDGGIRFSGFDIGSEKPPKLNDSEVIVATDFSKVEAIVRERFGGSLKLKHCANWEEMRRWYVALLRDADHPGRKLQELPIVQDNDVLDTWFSSALWPFATLGWPKDNTPPPPPAVPLPGEAGEDSLSSPSPDGEGDHAQHGGGVRYKLPGKTNAAVLRAKAMRRNMPPSEITLWQALKERPGGLKFRRQHPAGDYVLDFFCPSAALAIEVDGEAHDRADRPRRDAKRDSFLQECGVETLRIPAHEVFDDLESVVAAIVQRAKERTPLHQPAAGPPPREAGEDLFAKHYPNDLLISGFDILFFWDARMMMMGRHLTGQNPWPRLYLHGLVRAPDGQKMSKSKGNVVDPLGLIDRYGADALRFFMAAMESSGTDIKMDDSRVEGYRNFATKLWNAARFCQSNGIGASSSIAAPEAAHAVNRWIIGEVIETQASLDKALTDLRFDAAANTLYHFVWDRFCDWYLELIKPLVTPAQAGVQSESADRSQLDSGLRRNDEEGTIDAETKAVAGWALDQILVMLHPIMPFITEELWSLLGDRADYPLITAKWPAPQAEVDTQADSEINRIIDLIQSIRSGRMELNVPASAKPHLHVFKCSDHWRDVLTQHGSSIGRLARVVISFDIPTGAFPSQNVRESVDSAVQKQWAKKGALLIEKESFSAAIRLEGLIDIDAEKSRLDKALGASRKEAKSLEGRLGNAKFVEKAKPEAVEKARADHAHHTAEVERLEAALARLG